MNIFWCCLLSSQSTSSTATHYLSRDTMILADGAYNLATTHCLVAIVCKTPNDYPKKCINLKVITHLCITSRVYGMCNGKTVRNEQNHWNRLTPMSFFEIYLPSRLPASLFFLRHKICASSFFCFCTFRVSFIVVLYVTH